MGEISSFVVSRSKRHQWRHGVIGFNKTSSHWSGRERSTVGLRLLVTSGASTSDWVHTVASPYKPRLNFFFIDVPIWSARFHVTACQCRLAAWWRRQQPGRATRRVVAEGGIGTTVGGCGMHCGEQQPLIRVLDRFTVSAEHQWAST